MPTHKIALDVLKRPGRVPPQVVVRQGEEDTEVIEVEVLNGGEPYETPLPNARLDIMHADGRWARVRASKSGSTVTCTLPNAAMASPGLCRFAHFVFFDGTEESVSTEGFKLRILPCVDTSGAHMEAQSYDDLLTALWVKWSEYEEGAEANEEARTAAEKIRSANEKERQANELARKDAEGDRADAEKARESNEATRKSNETARKSAETKRANAEKQRADSEASRASAEGERVAAERGRVEAEKSRASEFAVLKANAQSATNAANGAASNANAAASTALQIANSVAQGSAGDSDVAELRDQVSSLGSMVADLRGDFYCLDGTVYAPSSKASISGQTVTLASSCTASGTTINLA